MIDTSNPAVLWLVITNFAMAAVVLVCCVLIGGAVVRELLARMRKPAEATGTHVFRVPELGLTMADGGEPEDRREAKHRSR